MSKSLSMSRAVGKLIAIGLPVLACGRTSETGKTTETASGTPSVVGAKADTFRIDRKDVYDESWTTPLPEGVSSNADTFRVQLKRMMAVTFPSGGRHPRQRAGKNCSGCSVTVEIGAISPTRPIDPGIPPRPRPRAVALLQNLDASNTEAYYGLKPKKNADYYFWIDAASGKSRITVLEVPPSGSVHAGKQKYLDYCHRYPHNDTANFGDADFAEYQKMPCDKDAGGMSQESVSPFSLAVISKMFARALKALYPTAITAEDGWIDCNSGCCW